ncbi:MAG: sigma-54 dependent transcriptional regulator [Acidobacteriota bacterium]|nr:sigma-54 dependent transcriptional regulator [Blastocatellia bacterium]MDW8239894.1 sigma-54 dependent transcriptional regulator [Acidobacteriota bacterium]
MKQKLSAIDIKKNFPRFIAADSKTVAVLQQAAELAASEVDLLLVGESGAGKELLAHSIHELSSRAAGPFIPLNVSAFPETVFEAELFGYEAGAFTGAAKRRQGWYEQAHGGTLFLDEIGHLPLSQQVRLLRVLQEKAFHRLGGRKLIQADVRVMAATDRDLDKLVEQNQFLRSLYFRFPARLVLPPLRARPADIPALVRYFLVVYTRKHQKNLISVSAEAMAYLKRQSWPGNVRQLLSVLEVAVIHADPTRQTLEVDDVEPLLKGWEDTPARLVSGSGLAGLDHLRLDQICELAIRQRLEVYRGNKSKAAESLGISRGTFRAWCKKDGIEADE